MKNAVAIAIMMVLLAMPVVAQQDGPLVVLTDVNASIAVLGLTVDQTVGKDVYDSEGNLLGTVSRVLGDDGDMPLALIVEGGGRMVKLELASAELINNRIVAQLTGEEYEGLPAFLD